MTPHREGAWTGGDERPPPALPKGPNAAVEFGAMAGAAALVGGCASSVGAGIPVGILTFGFGSLGLLGRHADDRKRVMRERAASLREEFGAGPAWIVDLMVRQGEAPTGCDQGLLWIEGGRILFSGFRTSFALVPEQAAARVRYDAGVPGLRFRLNLVLARETPAGPLSLSFWPIAESMRRAEDDAANLRYALNTVLEGRWTQKTPPEGQWPPLAVGPGAPPPKAMLRSAIGRVLGWTVLAAFVASAFLTAAAPWPALVVFVLLAAGANWAIARENAPRWRAYRDAKRIQEAA